MDKDLENTNTKFENVQLSNFYSRSVLRNASILKSDYASFIL